MTAFPRAPVAYAEGKPGNVFIYDCSRTGPGIGSKDSSRPNSFIGRAGRGQGNPGQRTGQTVGYPADFDRRIVARQCGPGHSAGPGSQGDHEPGGTGSRFFGG